MAETTSTTKKKKINWGAGAVRTIAPAIPLAIALAHAHMAPKPVAPLPSPAPISSSTAAGPLDCDASVPCPLVAQGHPVTWWFVFKLNASKFPKCGTPASDGAGVDTRTCLFDSSRTPTAYSQGFGQRYVVASDDAATLTDGGPQCLGSSTSDPVGASFSEIYNGNFHYVIWNDQPYGDPKIAACTSKGNCDGPWGHSKGIVAWNDAGEGFVMQVSTPSWPAAGSPKSPRKLDGNTLGCVKDDDVEVSQHFFALKLTKSDLVLVLQGLANASVVTDPTDPQVVNNGGPADVQALVSGLGKLSKSDKLVSGTLSTGVQFLSKPSAMNVPPWQMVSAQLGGVGLRAATWWASPEIPSTTGNSTVSCWDQNLGTPGPVEIATTGTWDKVVFSLAGGLGTNFNHAKIAVSTTGNTRYAIFGDENQQGTLTSDLTSKGCNSSQDARGGTFYVVQNDELAKGIAALITGQTAETQEGTCPGGGTCTPWVKPTDKTSSSADE
jgi:hypothetical protein